MPDPPVQRVALVTTMVLLAAVLANTTVKLIEGPDDVDEDPLADAAALDPDLGAYRPSTHPIGASAGPSTDDDAGKDPSVVGRVVDATPVDFDRAAFARPNVVIILTDDQNTGTMAYMPRTQERLFDAGVNFTHGYVTTPVCCPSRASILTGQYSHNHGTTTNEARLHGRTIAHDLQDAGYLTGHVGKYLNSWAGHARPEFDHWVAHGEAASKYHDPRLNVNGVWSVHQGYITHIFRDEALSFLDRAAIEGKPFFLHFAPNAPHGPAEPAPGDEDLYRDLAPRRPPSLNEEDVSDKPAWIQALPPLTEEKVHRRDDLYRRQLATLKPVDEAVDAILDRLDALGLADDTVVFFLSDNGIFHGEHRLVDKFYVYEESTHVPFAMRYPPLAPTPRVVHSLVANIDVPATIYDLAGVTPSRALDGRSIVDLLTGHGDPWRDELYLEAVPRTSPPWVAVHTGRYVYVETRGDLSELYDLWTDPYQLENLAQRTDPDLVTIRDDLKQRLDTHRAPGGFPRAPG